MRMRWFISPLVLICALLATAVFAVEPDEILDDPALEARARALSAEVRCVVCQNEPIDSSNAGVARDLRLLIRERLVAGDTDKQVLDYLVSRYGDYVLFRPPLRRETLALWLGPFVIAAMAALGVGLMLMRRPRRILAKDIALSPQEEAELDQMRDTALKDKA